MRSAAGERVGHHPQHLRHLGGRQCERLVCGGEEDEGGHTRAGIGAAGAAAGTPHSPRWGPLRRATAGGGLPMTVQIAIVLVVVALSIALFSSGSRSR